MNEVKKNLLTREDVERYEKELHQLKDIKRKEVSEKLKEARAQGDLSENAEYDAAKDEQRDMEARIFELENLLKNVEIVDEEGDGKKVAFGSTVRVQDKETKEEFTYTIKGALVANTLEGIISNESPLGSALIGAKKGDTITVEAPVGTVKYKLLEIVKDK
ncbi:MAG: transcription elongation factor GreA [Lachnospiraceae bacterium]|jgi:transcription elongation factor GreA|nr:transcription elongation factor GreA [Lachnospiraceae bacterium]